jgi:hypothetical protein
MNLKEPYDPDIYASPFLPVTESLVARADDAERAENSKEACELYLQVTLNEKLPKRQEV